MQISVYSCMRGYVVGWHQHSRTPAHQHNGLDEHLADIGIRLSLLVWRQILQVNRQP